MSEWLVPVTTYAPYRETVRRRVVRVEAEDEWWAQGVAVERVLGERWTPKNPSPERLEVGHAIVRGSDVCGFGCCALRVSR